jgi:hypothetical protein
MRDDISTEDDCDKEDDANEFSDRVNRIHYWLCGTVTNCLCKLYFLNPPDCFCPRPDLPGFWKYISLHITSKASEIGLVLGNLSVRIRPVSVIVEASRQSGPRA